ASTAGPPRPAAACANARPAFSKENEAPTDDSSRAAASAWTASSSRSASPSTWKAVKAGTGNAPATAHDTPAGLCARSSALCDQTGRPCPAEIPVSDAGEVIPIANPCRPYVDQHLALTKRGRVILATKQVRRGWQAIARGVEQQRSARLRVERAGCRM